MDFAPDGEADANRLDTLKAPKSPLDGCPALSMTAPNPESGCDPIGLDLSKSLEQTGDLLASESGNGAVLSDKINALVFYERAFEAIREAASRSPAIRHFKLKWRI